MKTPMWKAIQNQRGVDTVANRSTRPAEPQTQTARGNQFSLAKDPLRRSFPDLKWMQNWRNLSNQES